MMNAQTRSDVLESLAKLLSESKDEILDANKRDISACPHDDLVIYDRLKVDDAKVERMIASVRSVIAANDPVGKLISTFTREDGLRIENRSVPFGTILIIYEARPDVTIEAAVIALKAGNKILLKGGKEARNTNLCLAELWQKALAENAADVDFVKYLDFSREETQKLIEGKAEKFDIIIPRGGETLIEFVLKNSKMPVIVSGRGNNFAYIDSEADFEMAVEIVLDGKSRLSVCNALDKVLIDEKIPDLHEKINRIVNDLCAINIEVFGDASVHSKNPSVKLIENEDVWYEEFLSAKMVVAVVPDIDGAIEKINKYSGGHSATIITKNKENAEKFMQEVDCATVYHNASTRFTDGGEFGLGAEIAISTQKLHFRGPLGAEHLLTNKWFVFGNGQIRN
jgi:glutamate-5-semialdehyde dehydrogenase